MHRGHDFTGRGTNHREAKDAIVIVADKGLHKALSLISRLRPEYRVHRQPCDPCNDALAFRFAFTQPYMGEWGISEHAIWNQPITRAAVSSCQIVTYDSKIVFGYVSELWAAGAFPHGPYLWRTRFQPSIDANVTATVQLNAGLLQSNSGGIRNTPHRNQDVAAIDVLLSGEGAHDNGNLVSRSSTYPKQFGLDKNLNTFAAENAPNLLRDIDILPSQELRTGFDDRHVAAKATISLRQFQTGIAPADHDQVSWQIIELQSLNVREGLGGLQSRERSEWPHAFRH